MLGKRVFHGDSEMMKANVEAEMDGKTNDKNKASSNDEPTEEDLLKLRKIHNTNSAMYDKIGGKAFMERLTIRMEAVALSSALVLTVIYPYLVDPPTISNQISRNAFAFLSIVASILCMINLGISISMIAVFTSMIPSNKHFVLFLIKYGWYFALPEKFIGAIMSCWLIGIVVICFDMYSVYVGFGCLVLEIIGLGSWIIVQKQQHILLNEWAIDSLVTYHE